uniref:Uncharacterized protein n=1 Tax=Anopheles atroparvus TaxID=41427 RepID=A0AAG5DUN3_ANOAO
MIGNRSQNVQSRMPVKFPKERRPLQDLSTNFARSSALPQNKLQKLQSKGNGEATQLRKVVVYEPTSRLQKNEIKDGKPKNKRAPVVEKRILRKGTLFDFMGTTSRQATHGEPSQRRPKSAATALDTLTKLATMSIENSKCDNGYAKGENVPPENQSPQKQPLENNTVAYGYAQETLNTSLPHKNLVEVDIEIASKSQSAVGYFDKAILPKTATDSKLEQAETCVLKRPLPIEKKEEKSPILNAAAPEWKEFKDSIFLSQIEESVPAQSVPEDFQYVSSVPIDVPSPRGRKILGRQTSPVASFVSVKQLARQGSQSSAEYLEGLLNDRDDELYRYIKQREMRRQKAITAMLLEQKRKLNAPSSRSQTSSSTDQTASIPNQSSSVSNVLKPPYPYGGWHQFDPMAPCTCNGQQVPASGTTSQRVDARIRYEPKELLQLNYRKQSCGKNTKIETKLNKRW